MKPQPQPQPQHKSARQGSEASTGHHQGSRRNDGGSDLPCPICGKPASRTAQTPGGRSPFPFCTDRCRLIDLGRWLDGAYQIPAEEDSPPGDEAERRE